MAHHVAELIDAAETAPSDEERRVAGERAVITILRIWKHRVFLSGNAHPLKAFDNVLVVLDRLRPSNNPFTGFGNHVGSRRDQLAAELFDSLTRLTIALLIGRMPPDTDVAPKAATDALNPIEQRILASLQEWGDVIGSPSTKRAGRRTKPEEPKALDKEEFAHVTKRLLDRASKVLGELGRELERD